MKQLTDTSSLTQIINNDAAALHGVTVAIDRRYCTVSIDGRQSLFIQGDDAATFIDAVDALSEKVPLISFDAIALHMAYPYI